ncbi:MAG: type II toxin-antitoxin system MqsA family antitoxin [Symbiobacteriaceae bacterium]|nr:type II toxin-antitoxin system MqsA family antitoxin [Symbiobacteriaceae bacterium]
MCKGHGRLEDKLTTFMTDLGKCVLIVKNVPTHVCTQCGERAYSNDVAKQLEMIANSFKDAIIEVAIVNYPDRAA